MPYLRNGQVVNRSVFRLSIVVDAIWMVLNMIGLFIGTMSAKTPTRKRKSERGYHNYIGGGGGGGGDDGSSGGRRRGPNIHRHEPPPPGCGSGPMVGG